MIKDQIDQIIAAALNAVNPYNAIQNHLRLDGGNLIIGKCVINLIDRVSQTSRSQFVLKT